MGVPQKGRFIRENPTRMDDLGVSLIILGNLHVSDTPDNKIKVFSPQIPWWFWLVNGSIFYSFDGTVFLDHQNPAAIPAKLQETSI